MGKEIERKFLINQEKWSCVDKPKGQVYLQGYIITDPNKTIRVRITETKSYLTIKGLSVGAIRPEYEYEIPIKDANELLDNFSVTELSKIRYKIHHSKHLWEVDEFLGDNLGLFVAEIELSDETESFEIPEWVGIEVTSDERYYNTQLSINPFRNWKH